MSLYLVFPEFIPKKKFIKLMAAGKRSCSSVSGSARLQTGLILGRM